MTTRREFLVACGALGTLPALRTVPAAAQAAADPWKQGFDAALAANPALLGFQGVNEASLASADLAVEGRWPQALVGTFYRNGPAGHEVGGKRYHHWFDGNGMVQAFEIADGRIRHVGRFVATAKWRAEQEAGRMLWPAFGTPLADGLPVSSPDTINVANTSLLHHAGELLALWEGGSPYRLDPRSLETFGTKTWRDDLRGIPFTAHPKVEPDGTLWAFGYMYMPQGSLMLYRIDAAGKLRAVGKVPGAALGMVHDFAVTAHHLVFVLPPLVFERERLRAGSSILDAHVWRPEIGTRVLAVRKDDFSQHRWWQLPAGMTFHFGNAWEDGDVMRFDYCVAPDATELMETFREIMRGVWRRPSRPTRLAQVKLGKGDAVEQRLLDRAAEFPRVAPGVVGRRHRHVYSLAGAAGQGGRSEAPLGLDRVACWDTESGEAETYTYGAGFIPEEHVFVPHSGAAAEGTGWVMGTALDLERGVTQLAVFDAERLGDGPLAVARLPYPLPLGFHGIFVPA
jgi:carotenoid cleavage dioxygenase